MRQKFGQALIATLLILLLGGHWFILQSLAWAGMFAAFSQSEPWSVAWVKTFDGNHRCKLCLFVQEGKETEQKRSAVQIDTKLDLFVNSIQPAWARNIGFTAEVYPRWAEHLLGRSEAPPAPPPRLA